MSCPLNRAFEEVATDSQQPQPLDVQGKREAEMISHGLPLHNNAGLPSEYWLQPALLSSQALNWASQAAQMGILYFSDMEIFSYSFLSIKRLHIKQHFPSRHEYKPGILVVIGMYEITEDFRLTVEEAWSGRL